MSQTLLKDHQWKRETENGEFLISTSNELLDFEFIDKAFGAPEMYWAKPIGNELIATMVSQSLNLGLYKILPAAPKAKTSDSPSSPRTPSPTIEGEPQEHLEMIGYGRWITDHVTTAYLTDVYVLPEYRQHGLGKWLIACCNEVLAALPAMRRGLLMASPGVGERFYSREMGFYNMTEESDHVVCMTRRAYKMGSD